jgi:hypothetical protein
MARSARDELSTQMDLAVLPRTVLLNKSAPTRTVLPCKNRQRRWLEKFGIFAISLLQIKTYSLSAEFKHISTRGKTKEG